MTGTRSMTDTRTPDARLREAAEAAREALAIVMTVQELARQAGNADLFAALEPARHAHGLVVAALTGDADTPEPGLDVGRLALAVQAAMSDTGRAVDYSPLARDIANAYRRLATHPVEAPRPMSIDEQVDLIEATLHPEGRCQTCGGGKPYWRHDPERDGSHEFVPEAPHD